MSKKNVLISAVCGDIGNSIVRALKDEGFRIIGCDMQKGLLVPGLLDGFYQVPSAKQTQEYLKTLTGIIQKEKIDFFIPVSEPEITVLNDNRKWVEGSAAIVLLNNKKVLDSFLDKLKTMEYLSGLNIKTPRTVSLSQYKGDFGFPLIVKGRRSCGSKELWRVTSDEELAFLRKKDQENLIAQEYLGEDQEEYTTGVFSDGNNVSSITFKRKLGFGGLSIVVEFVESPYLEELSSKIAKNIGLVGSINIQSRKVKSEFIPFEINPRLSSTVLFRKKFGFNDASWWIQALSGKGYKYEKIFKSGKGVRHLTESFFDMVER